MRSRSRDRPLHDHINTILGGFVGGGSSSSAHKHQVWALKIVHLVDRKLEFMLPITFTNEEFKVPNPDQDDRMVITVEIAHYGLSKVLIDQGSTINILYWKTLLKIDLSKDLIVSYDECIFMPAFYV